MEHSNIDGFRFIDHLQTTARQLRVFSAIVLQLNKRQLPRNLLEQLLINWSIIEEKRNEEYNISKGKITNNGIKTTSITYYLSISSSLGLIYRLNNMYVNSKVSKILYFFLKKQVDKKRIGLSLSEKIFYLYQLLMVDADGIILALEQLKEGKKNQKFLQKNFKDSLSQRLLLKQKSAPLGIEAQISNKYKTINFIWRNSEKYAEHIIAPRYEWLSDLELVKIERDAKSTFYNLSEKGNIFFESIPKLGTEENVRDINIDWINRSFFSTADNIFGDHPNTYFSKLDDKVKKIELGNSLELASMEIDSSASFKLPLYETYLFVCIEMLVKSKIVINFSEITDELESSFLYKAKHYKSNIASRTNESYITITKAE